jgi:hypothetical protein
MSSALHDARERQAALRQLIVEAYGNLARRHYDVALVKLEEALARAAAVGWYLAPDETGLDRLVAAAAVTRELFARLDLDSIHQAGEILRAAVDLRARIHLGER